MSSAVFTRTDPRTLSISDVAARRIGLFLAFVIFEMINWIMAQKGVVLDLKTWMFLALASSMGGRAIAYMSIGEWIRWPFTAVVAHSSGAGEDVEPKYTTGWLSAISALVACPICAGAWTGLGLLFMYVFWPELGLSTIYLFSIAAGAWLLTRITEAIEAWTWVAREVNGYYSRINQRE